MAWQPRREMVEVDLVEDDSAAPTPTADGAPPARSRRPVRVAVAVALVVGLGAAAVVVTERQPRPAGGSVAGSVPTLISPLAQTWRIDTPEGWTAAGDLVITTSQGPDGPVVHAYSLTSGGPVWTVQAPSGARAITCAGAVSGPAGPVLACRTVQHVAQMHHFPNGSRDDPGQLLLLSATDGSVVSQAPLPVGHVAMAPLGTDLLLADVSRTARSPGRPGARSILHVARRDVVSGREVWQTDLPLAGYLSPEAVHVAVSEGMVVVTGPLTVVLDGSDGRRAVTVPVPVSADLPLPEVTVSARGIGVRTAAQAGGGTTRWYGLDGTDHGTIQGAVVEPALRDGSAPGVVLTSTGAKDPVLHGVGVDGGAVLWSVPLDGGTPVIRIGGDVVVAGGGELRAVDLRTGQVRWRSPALGLDSAEPVTDGAFVLTAGRVGTEPTSMSAVSLHDGSLLWRAALPAGVRSLQVLASRVVGVGPGVLVGLG